MEGRTQGRGREGKGNVCPPPHAASPQRRRVAHACHDAIKSGMPPRRWEWRRRTTAPPHLPMSPRPSPPSLLPRLPSLPGRTGTSEIYEGSMPSPPNLPPFIVSRRTHAHRSPTAALARRLYIHSYILLTYTYTTYIINIFLHVKLGRARRSWEHERTTRASATGAGARTPRRAITPSRATPDVGMGTRRAHHGRGTV